MYSYVKVFYCAACQIPTESQEALLAHLHRQHASATPPAQPACRGCGQAVPPPASLAEHERICCIFRPYRCEYTI